MQNDMDVPQRQSKAVMDDDLAKALAAKEAVYPEVIKKLKEVKREVISLADKTYGSHLHKRSLANAFDKIIRAVEDAKPYEEIPDEHKGAFATRSWWTKAEKELMQ